VVAMSINRNPAGGMVEDLIVPLVREVTGVQAPPWPVPSPEHGPDVGDSSRFAGRYVTDRYDFEVTSIGAELIVKRTPKALAAAMGLVASTKRYTPVTLETFIAADHDTVAFVEDGRYLHAGRAAVRVGISRG
jgi:hypothetical protein